MTVEEARHCLSLPYSFTTEDLKAAFKRAALRCHPDHGGSVADMQRVNEARSVLDGHAVVIGVRTFCDLLRSYGAVGFIYPIQQVYDTSLRKRRPKVVIKCRLVVDAVTIYWTIEEARGPWAIGSFEVSGRQWRFETVGQHFSDVLKDTDRLGEKLAAVLTAR